MITRKQALEAHSWLRCSYEQALIAHYHSQDEHGARFHLDLCEEHLQRAVAALGMLLVPLDQPEAAPEAAPVVYDPDTLDPNWPDPMTFGR